MWTVTAVGGIPASAALSGRQQSSPVKMTTFKRLKQEMNMADWLRNDTEQGPQASCGKFSANARRVTDLRNCPQQFVSVYRRVAPHSVHHAIESLPAR